MIRKIRFSINTNDYLVPGFSKINLFSRAGLTKIEIGEFVRIVLDKMMWCTKVNHRICIVSNLVENGNECPIYR